MKGVNIVPKLRDDVVQIADLLAQRLYGLAPLGHVLGQLIEPQRDSNEFVAEDVVQITRDVPARFIASDEQILNEKPECFLNAFTADLSL